MASASVPARRSSISEPRTMTATTALSAEEFVARLLAIEGDDERHAFIDQTPLPPEGLHDAVLRLVDDVEHLRLANPHRAEGICADARTLAGRAGDPFLRAMAYASYADILRTRG